MSATVGMVPAIAKELAKVIIDRIKEYLGSLTRSEFSALIINIFGPLYSSVLSLDRRSSSFSLI